MLNPACIPHVRPHAPKRPRLPCRYLIPTKLTATTLYACMLFASDKEPLSSLTQITPHASLPLLITTVIITLHMLCAMYPVVLLVPLYLIRSH